MLRCTAKVLALLRVSGPAIGEACARDWYAHLVWINKQKCLLVTHAGTLFSVFMPNVTAAGLRPIGRPVVSAIRPRCKPKACPSIRSAILIPSRWPWPRPPTAASWAHQRLAFTTEHIIATAGGLARCDIDALHHGLHRTINSITGYIPPIDLVTLSRQDQQ